MKTREGDFNLDFRNVTGSFVLWAEETQRVLSSVLSAMRPRNEGCSAAQRTCVHITESYAKKRRKKKKANNTESTEGIYERQGCEALELGKVHRCRITDRVMKMYVKWIKKLFRQAKK